MAKYLAKRLAQSLIAILGITVVVFVILHLTGDPVELMVSPTTSREQMDILRQEMGFNDPLPQQYLRFLKGAVVGDFGTSYYYNEPAMRVVMERVPATLELAVAALAAEGETEIQDAECVNISYPEFYEDLRRLTR